MNLKKLLRPNITKLKPYSSARDEFKGEASVFLDANESPYQAPYNRYPDPLQQTLKQEIIKLKGQSVDRLFLGVGSDEPIDLLMRAFCRPGIDNIVAPDPTYGMYEVCANINDIAYRKVPLGDNFQLQAQSILAATDKDTKLIFLCSPNNPTGNLLDRKEIKKIIHAAPGVVVVDEAYVDFSPEESWLTELELYPNLVVLQTFSKAWASAAIRLGMAFASPAIVSILNKIKYPYNINELTQRYGVELLRQHDQIKEWVSTILSERSRMSELLTQCEYVQQIYPSDSNFILVKLQDADTAYNWLLKAGVVVRNRNNITLCKGCLRITIGTQQQNDTLIQALKAL